MAMPWPERAPAVVQAWFGGQEMGDALAEILDGTAEPSGRMPITVPIRIEDTPTFGNFPGEAGAVSYGEGLLIGHRWYDSRDLPVAVPFGHGGSYTTFDWRDVSLSDETIAAGDPVTVEVTVSNTGSRIGSEVVQVYVEPPAETPVFRPRRELKGFAHVRLAPGEEHGVAIELDWRSFAYWQPEDTASRYHDAIRSTPFAANGARTGANVWLGGRTRLLSNPRRPLDRRRRARSHVADRWVDRRATLWTLRCRPCRGPCRCSHRVGADQTRTEAHMTFPLPGDEQLQALGLDAAATRPPTSDQRFPDGGAWRIEIPSVEGPEPLRAVLDEAARLDVPIHRVSQGSGVMMLDDGEITDMLAFSAERSVELCLFLGPRGTWDVGAATRSASGGAGPRRRGRDQLGQCLADCRRAADLGVRNLLVADEGVLWAAHRLRDARRPPGRPPAQGQCARRPGEPGRVPGAGRARSGLRQRPRRPDHRPDRRVASGIARGAGHVPGVPRRHRRVHSAL